MNNTKERAFYLVGFPAGHGAVDAGSAALWIIAPFIAASLGLSSTQVGLNFTVMAISAGMTHIPASLVEETRFRGIFLLSTFWWVAAAAWHPVAMGTMAERMPDRRAMAPAVHYVGGSFMEVLAPVVAGVLLVFMDWRSLASSNPVGSHSACDDRCANAGGIRHHGSVTCPYCHDLKHRRRMSDDYDWPYHGDWRGSRRSGSDAGRSGWGGRPAAVVSGCVNYGLW